MAETITYKPSEMAQAIRDLDPTLMYMTDLNIITEPDRTYYAVGETFDPTGAFVEASFNNDFCRDATSGMTYSPTVVDNTMQVEGTYTIKGVTKNVYFNLHNFASVTWADGSDDAIIQMVESARNGYIDLHDYWGVGDERTISLKTMASDIVGEGHEKQDVIYTILDSACTNYTYAITLSSGRTTPFFIVGQKPVLKNKGYMNSTATNTGSWGSTARRNWCNSIYYNAISNIKEIFAPVNVITAETYNGTTLQTTQDYCFFPAMKEIVGGTGTSAGSATGYSNLTEYQALTQWEYYANNSYYKYINDSTTASIWWSRSPYYNNETAFCGISSGAYASNYNANTVSPGIAPCVCI